MAISVGTSTNSSGANATSCTVTIHSSVASGDLLVLGVVNRDSISDPTVTDDDTGGNTWTKLVNQVGIVAATQGSITIWYKRATSGSASKTITASGCTGACAAICTPYTGASPDALAPFGTPVGEANSSTNHVQVGITVARANSWVGFFAGDCHGQLDGLSAFVATDPSSLADRALAQSSAGGKCSLNHASAVKTTAGATGNISWSQTQNGQVASSAFEILIALPALAATGDSCALTGSDATLRVTRKITADVDSNSEFVQTGSDANLLGEFKLSADSGAFDETGSDATLIHTAANALNAQSGDFVVTGSDATLEFVRTVAADSGEFDLTGSDVDFVFGNARIHHVDSAVTSGFQTTGFALEIPSTVIVGDVLLLGITNRDATTEPTVSDNGTDVGGNTWSKLFSQNAGGNGSLHVFWKRAKANTNTSVVTVTDCTGSAAGAVVVYRGLSNRNLPFGTPVTERNLLGDKSNAGVTTIRPNSWVAVFVADTRNDDDNADSFTATTPATLTKYAEGVSTGGNDCALIHAAGSRTDVGATGTISWSFDTDAQNASGAFELIAGLDRLDATAGTFVSTGGNVTFHRTYRIVAGADTIVETGKAASLFVTPVGYVPPTRHGSAKTDSLSSYRRRMFLVQELNITSFVAVDGSSQNFEFSMLAGELWQFVSDINCFIAQGVDPEATIGEGSVFVPANTPIIVENAFDLGPALAVTAATGETTGSATLTRLRSRGFVATANEARD